MISESHVVHSTLCWQNEKVCGSVRWIWALVHFILFAAKAISMTSLDHWIKKYQNVLHRKQCQELRGYLPTWSSSLIFLQALLVLLLKQPSISLHLQARIFICLDHSYRFLTGLFVSTLVNSNLFSKLHESDRNTNYYVLSQLKSGSVFSWDIKHLTKALGAIFVLASLTPLAP